MTATTPFLEAANYRRATLGEFRGVRLAADFGAPVVEYRAAREGVALFDRSDRGLLVATGHDRQDWLHNLVTNAVKTLDDHTGNYAFAVNIKGRILFDLNILCLPDALWLDLDALAVSTAAAHFDRYLFTEDVRIEDAGGQFARLGCSGPQAGAAAGRLGVTNFAALPALASVALADAEVRLVRHDFAGGPGFELILPRGQAAAWWDRLVAEGARPAGWRVLDVLRIEAGIPWLGRDLDEHVLPAETGQVERAVSYQKGCYLGQEIIERMRAHGVLAKRLVRLRTGDGTGLALPATLWQQPSRGSAAPGPLDVGRITSLVQHPLEPYWTGLGYLKTPVADCAGITADEPPRAVTIQTT